MRRTSDQGFGAKKSRKNDISGIISSVMAQSEEQHIREWQRLQVSQELLIMVLKSIRSTRCSHTVVQLPVLCCSPTQEKSQVLALKEDCASASIWASKNLPKPMPKRSQDGPKMLSKAFRTPF